MEWHFPQAYTDTGKEILGSYTKRKASVSITSNARAVIIVWVCTTVINFLRNYGS